jgi:drug/metabolite transporter (DMT)-like permease
MLGTLLMADPDRARIAGFFLHLVNGQGLALGYAAVFAATDEATWWAGARRAPRRAHAATMVTVTVLILAGIVVRVAAFWDEPSTPGLALALTLAAAALTVIGSSIGGSIAYNYGFNVEVAGDHSVWHRSEVDVFPGDKDKHPPAAPGDDRVDVTGADDRTSPRARR